MKDWTTFPRGPWSFQRQRNKWAYLNNPRWSPIPRPFVPGGQDDYDGRESQEPLIWVPGQQPHYPSNNHPVHHQCGHWHIPAPAYGPLPQGISFPVYFEMVGTWLFSDEVDMKWTCTEIEIDPADYGGIGNIYSAEFEAVAKVGAISKAVHLMDESDALIGSISFNPLTGWNGYQRKAVYFPLNPAKTKYYVFTPADDPVDPDSYMTTDFRSTRVILRLVNPTKAYVPIHMFDGDESSGGGLGDAVQNNLWAYAKGLYTSGGAYGYSYDGTDQGWWRHFLLTKGNWATVNHWRLEVIGCALDAWLEESVTGYAALFNRTKNLMVAGTEITFTDGTGPERKTIDFLSSAVNFDDGDEFELRIKMTDEGAFSPNFFIYRASLGAYLDSPTKAEVHIRVGTCINGWYGGSGPGENDYRYDYTSRYRHRFGLFPVGTGFYHECTARAVGDTPYIELFCCDTSDSGFQSMSFSPSVITPTDSDAEPLVHQWLNPDNSKDQDNDVASIQMDSPNDFASLRASGFDTSGLPPGITVRQITALVTGAVDTQDSYVQINGGANQPWIHRDWLGIPPIILLTGHAYDLGAVVPAFIDLKVKQNNNTNLTWWGIDWIGLMIAWGDPVLYSQLTYIAGTRMRQRIGSIAGLLGNDQRYISHVYATSALENLPDHSSSFLIAIIG